MQPIDPRLTAAIDEIEATLYARTGKRMKMLTPSDVLAHMAIFQTAIMMCDARKNAAALHHLANKDQKAHDAVAAAQDLSDE